MERKKYKDWVWRISLLVFILCIVEGCLYYQNSDNAGLAAAHIFQNAIKAYKIDPDIEIDEAYKFFVSCPFGESNQIWLSIMTVVYCLAVLIAPFCTVAMLLILAKKAGARLSWIKNRMQKKKTDLLVIGNGDLYGHFMKNLPKDCNVTTFVDKSFPEDEIINFMRQGINVRVRYGDEKKNIFEAMKSGKLAKFDAFLLCNNSGIKNLSLYDQLSKELTSAKSKKPVYICANEESSAEIIRAYDSNHKSDSLFVNIIDPKKIAVNRTLEQHPFHQYYRSDMRDVHMGIIGFGEFGQNMLIQGLNMAVLSADSVIRIDVFDRKIRELLGAFMKRFAPEASDILELVDGETVIGEKVKGYRLALGKAPFETDGITELYFWETDTQKIAFNAQLRKCHSEMPFTYLVVATADIDSISAATIGAMDVLKQTELANNVPIIVRTKDDVAMDIICEDDKENKRKAFKIISVSQNSDIFSYANMSEASTVDRAMVFNCIYDRVYDKINSSKDSNGSGIPSADEIRTMRLGLTAQDPEVKGKWDQMMYNRESSIAQSMHQTVKEWLLNSENGPKYSPADNEEELKKIEHRRWCTYMITHGYKFGPVTDGRPKNTDRKTHVCIVNWQNMDNEPAVAATKKYDLIPYLLMENDR